ncbi:MAG TPA: rhamnulokinase family protein, partial [Acidothermaceae bacterium]
MTVEDIVVAAVDLGATSGRVMLGRIGPGGISMEHIHRFPNEPIQLSTGLHWDLYGLFDEVLVGLRAAQQSLGAGESISSIGIDTWAVDYGLLDADAELLGPPFCYRDSRTAKGVDRVHAKVSPEELYAINGLQFLPFNTLYQLAAEQETTRWDNARTMLLLPDLLAYWLTGEVGAESTNASTTGLFDARTGDWALSLVDSLEIPRSMLPPLREPGAVIGQLLPDIAAKTGLPATTTVVAVGSHDTASAVLAVPADGDRFAYISSGTWSLVGLELPAPILSEASRTANFTNERGVDGTTRYLRNVAGLWLLNESIRSWNASGWQVDLHDLLEAAAALPDGGPVVDPNDAEFLAPGDMPARIDLACRESGQLAPTDPPAVVRCILDSLAHAYADTLADAVRLSGTSIETVHIVGGGSSNAFLCTLTARATGLPVVAGPVEATALGNVLVQARTAG